jgi:hypothetical protein
MSDDKTTELTPEEIARRRDDAIRRALNTPPKLKKKPSAKKPAKRRVKRKSA